MIKKIISSNLIRTTQYGKVLNNFQGKNVKVNHFCFPLQPLHKKENPNFSTLNQSKTILMSDPLKFVNIKFNYSTENKNRLSDPILKDQIFENENGKSFNSVKPNILINYAIPMIILIVLLYYQGEGIVNKIKEDYSELYNDITNQINESNKTIKELINGLCETNQLIIEQNNHEILIQNKRILVSIVLTLLSLIFFIMDFEKKYL
ncbi:hypothetical protein ACTA71_003118 [Dictyostelium dimigraforme]